jgi:hypothetical protein
MYYVHICNKLTVYMALERLQHWLGVLGYDAAGAALHRRADVIAPSHPFSVELKDLLCVDGQIGAHAVFEVQGCPTVAFFDDDGSLLSSVEQFDRIRQRIWNQNLISVVVVASNAGIVAYPLARKLKPELLSISQASLHGPFSAADIRSGEVQQRLPKWFKPEVRVDRQLLRNLKETVLQLEKLGHSREVAQTLMGQVLFISYLEHRNIVSSTYRAKRRVGSFHELVQARDIKGIGKLIACLRKDFNGDFLSIDPEHGELWDQAKDAAFPVLHDFLSRVDLVSGQKDFWNYDFSFIPVELLSGIYESFIGDEKHEMGAYYTPRQLANLVIELAFSSSTDPLEEYIYDGACGSGILLTTAFRRLVGFAEARRGTQMMLRDRIQLLKERIFGSDLNKMACKVTAFSLYLSLLENLKPSDVLALQENENVKLPTLQNSNLFSGPEKGDFFSPGNPLVTTRRFTLVISNPPWREPSRNERTSADYWAESIAGVTRSRRQMAGDFAFRAADCLVDGGRMCLIMPASLFLAPTSQEFVSGWLLKNRVHQLINFGDLMNFIFETAEHSCVVVSASPRSVPNRGIPPEEMIDYCAPKADTSIAFGRLTLASGDRHLIQTQAYFSDCTRLVTFMWGNEADLALLKRLQWSGTFRQMMAGPQARWVRRKGFHREDASVETPASSEPLRKRSFIEIDALKRGLPLVLTADLVDFPSSISEVAKLSDALLDVFKGPRIVFPDGFDRELEIRACYIDVPASFTSSIGVIAGPDEDANLLQFTAVYLRSDLVKYFLVMSAYQVVCDRNRVTLSDIDHFPFLTPAKHPDPKRAGQILGKVAALVDGLDNSNLLRPEDEFGPIREELNSLVFDYFGLTNKERFLVQEAVQELIPSVRPRGYASLHTQIQKRTEEQQMSHYVDALRLELADWQRELGGNGSVSVTALASNYAQAGSLGIVRVDLTGDPSRPRVAQDDNAVVRVLNELRARQLLPMGITDDLYFAPDTIIWTERALYMVRPLIRRFWLRHTAVRDARHIVTGIHKLNSRKQVA